MMHLKPASFIRASRSTEYNLCMQAAPRLLTCTGQRWQRWHARPQGPARTGGRGARGWRCGCAGLRHPAWVPGSAGRLRPEPAGSWPVRWAGWVHRGLPGLLLPAPGPHGSAAASAAGRLHRPECGSRPRAGWQPVSLQGWRLQLDTGDFPATVHV